jgi:hypothetical protein
MSEEQEIPKTPLETDTSAKVSEGPTLKGVAAIQGEAKAGSDWVDRGIVDVPVADLPVPEGVSSPADFDHHISWEDSQTALKQLPDIQKSVKEGKTRDDFFKDDQAAGLDYAHGKERVYDLFYGSDPVKLDKDGDQYTIVSGRHRIFTAKTLGLDTIPAKLSEKV